MEAAVVWHFVRGTRHLGYGFSILSHVYMCLAVSMLTVGDSGYCVVLPIQQAWVGYHVRMHGLLYRVAVCNKTQAVHRVVNYNKSSM